MKIFNTLQYRQYGGLEKFCIQLCNEFAKNNEVYLLGSPKIKEFLDEKVNFIEFDFNKNRYNPLFLRKIAKIIDKISPDIIQAHNIKELQLLSYARVFNKNIPPIVITKHSLENKKKLELADLVIAVSSGVYDTIKWDKKILIENGYSFIPPQKISRPEKFYITFAGRLHDSKGVSLFIEALSMVKFEYECHFFGFGDSEIYENKVASLGLSDKIKFRGFVKNINDYLYSCDLNVMPSFSEAFGLSALDGMYYSPLMISTKVGICQKIMPDELIFETNSESLMKKLNEAYENYDKFKEIFSKVKVKKDEFSVEKMAENYIKAYKKLIMDFKK